MIRETLLAAAGDRVELSTPLDSSVDQLFRFRHLRRGYYLCHHA